MIYTIADLHLSFSSDKPMDVFGPKWRSHTERLTDSWQNVVSAEDTVVIPGDISWAMKLEDALSDFEFIEKLNGKKIIMKGNHDYFWETASKLNAFFQKNHLRSLKVLHNNAYFEQGVWLCGTKGWWHDSDLNASQNEKLLNRETMRLAASLDFAKGEGERIVFLHYPPVFEGKSLSGLIEVMRSRGVRRCFYGHLHGAGADAAFEGEYEGISFSLVSADKLEFTPLKIEI